MLKTDIQLFAEEGDPGEQNPTPAAAPAKTTKGNKGGTYTSDYVDSLRRESETYKTAAKQNEAHLRSLLGVSDDDALGDVGARITTFTATQQGAIDTALKTANDRLIAAELKSQQGYDTKLLAKVIDLSTIAVDENGNVTGVAEAVAAAVKEFPAVKLKGKSGYSFTNPGAPDGEPDYQTRINAAREKGDNFEVVKLKREASLRGVSVI